MSFLKLGFVSIFLSDALISGYTAAAAFSIVVTQISVMFGLEDTFVPDGWFITPRVSSTCTCMYTCTSIQVHVLKCTRQDIIMPTVFTSNIIIFILLADI